MPAQQKTVEALAQIPHLSVSEQVPLSAYTRFGIGGPARIYIETADELSFICALSSVRASGMRFAVIGNGTNLIVSDEGFDGAVLRFTADQIQQHGTCVAVEAGAVLQNLVDYSIDHALEGLHTMTGIPGCVGAALYGNAGAYGHSISEFVERVRFFNGEQIQTLDNAQCEFEYRESVFKRHKHWTIFSTMLRLPAASSATLRKIADDILTIRNHKYPPSMKCAGSIFKNLLSKDLPDELLRIIPAGVIREGKVPSAWFLEQVHAKGMTNGDIRVADYHANLIYNAGHGTARQLCEVIAELKSRVLERFGLELEEEVQYVGFSPV